MQALQKNKALKVALFDKGLSQRELSKRTHIPEAYISRAINGSFNLTPQKRMKIAEILDKSVSELFLE